MMYEILKTDFKFKDIRGSLTQLAHNGWEQINVLITHKDVFRGGHYHKKTKEAFYVISGELVVTFTDKNGKNPKIYSFDDKIELKEGMQINVDRTNSA